MPVGNNIGFDDLFDSMAQGAETAAQGIDHAADRIEESARGIDKALKQIADSSKEAVGGLQNIDFALTEMQGEQQATQKALSGIAGEIANLDSKMGQVVGTAKQMLKALQDMKGASGPRGATHQLVQDAKTLSDAYAKMGIQINGLNLDMKTLSLTDKEYNKVIQLASQYNTLRGDSYTALSEKYRAAKILYDQMTESERVANADFVAGLRKMYEEMNNLQQATGKFQLQVGNYSKAMNGLNIATNQVIRELPTLANGAAQFAIAIGNNIPILIDNILYTKQSIAADKLRKQTLLEEAAAAEVAGDALVAAAKKQEAAAIKTTTVISAMAKTLFSWQTAIVVLLTVLPGLIRKLNEKRNALSNVNKELLDSLEYTTAMADAELKSAKAMANSVAEAETLYAISQSVNRTYEERIEAAKILKELHEEELANFSAEEIAVGKAKDAFDELTKSLLAVAQARAYMNKITEIYEGIAELQLQRIDVQKELETQTEKLATAEGKLMKATADYRDEAEYAITAQRKGSAEKEIVGINKAIEDGKKSIQALMDLIPVDGLAGIYAGKGGSSKQKAQEITDFLQQLLQARIDAMKDSFEKELRQYDLNFAILSVKMQDEMDKLLQITKTGNANEREEAKRQTAILSELWEQRNANYLAGRERMIAEEKDRIFKKYREVVADEVDYEIEEQKRLRTGLDAEYKLRRERLYKQYEDESISKVQLNEKLIELEQDYWKDYLASLRDNGALTVDAYNEIMSKLVKEDKKRKATFGSFTEFLFAQSSTFGESTKYGKAVKEQYKDLVQGIDSALQSSISSMKEWMDTRIQMAEIAVEAARKEVEATKSVLDYEMQARANGYANNVALAKKEYESKVALEKKAVAEQERLQKIQEGIETASQATNLLTATAKILSAYADIPIAGQALSIAALAAMWGTFAAAKIQASQITKTKTYGDGMSEYLDYGGSHASGNDIDFGTTKDGTRRRVERGEMIGVINKRNVRKYGVSSISDIFGSLNAGTFENRYGNAFSGIGLSTPVGVSSDLSKLENDVHIIMKQGEEKTTYAGNKKITYYKNVKRVVTNA